MTISYCTPLAATTPEQWLSAEAFSGYAGISERSARRIMSRAFDGVPWRGHALTVRKVPSRGGASGFAFQVHEASLPGAAADLPAIIPAAPAPPAAHPSPACSVAAGRHDIIRAALPHPPGSSERGCAVREAARIGRISKRTIYDWIAAYERDGWAGLRRRPRADRGQRKHTISRAWDAAVPFDDATKARIAADLERRVRSLWAATTEVGWRWVARVAAGYLAEQTVAAGFAPDARRLRKICTLSNRFVERGRRYRAVAIHDLDAKQWDDKHRPRIWRTIAARRPMEIVVCDVHPMDVLLPRADGSTFTAKLVVSHDWATNRLFVYLVFPARGEGVRQEHVVEAFIAMTQAPGWGVPQVLYIDNGSEYGCADLVADALQVNTQVRALGDDPEFRTDLLNRRRAIVRAQPYNASAKPIEGMFGVLERGVFSMLPGWIGGDRMTKKTANVGRAPVPYSHGEAAFRADLRNCIELYETNPQHGALGGRSPREVFQAAVEAGWQRMDISVGALHAAFAHDESRIVRQGAFSYEGRNYTAREIQALPAGTTLHLRIPICGGLDEIPVMDEGGGLLCMAAVDRPYDVLDTEGAKESGRRRATARAGVKALRADTEPLDMRAAIAGLASRQDPAPIPESAGVIRLSEGKEAIGRALERSPAVRIAAEDERNQLSRERTREARDRYLRKARANG